MKTKSLLFSIITGVVVNSYAFARESENTPLFNTDCQFNSHVINESETTSEDTLKVSNETETYQSSEQEKEKNVAAVFVTVIIGTGATVGICAMSSAIGQLSNIKFKRSW